MRGAAAGRQKLDLSLLNAAQRDAVTTTAGPLLVLAGAGTGKTRVITYRMAHLMDQGTLGERILAVTFTNKAAREMHERTQGLLGKRPASRPVVCTFHSLCLQVLREGIDALGYPKNFAIYDRSDQESAARKALRDLRLDAAALRPSDLLWSISRWKSAGIGPDEARDHVADDRDYLAAMGYRKYQLLLRASGAVDFDDLLGLTRQLFEEFPEVLARQQERFDHVQIDEYQDTNEQQFSIVADLVRPHHNLCVVGDDDQSIYGWRGAEVKHILGFARQFPGAKVVRLQENYRCTTTIIDRANALIGHNRERHDKQLQAVKEIPNSVAVREYGDEEQEAESVVREIEYLIRSLGSHPRDFAILFRTNEQPRLFESELLRKKVPYTLIGGQSFFERKEIRDLLSYLRVLASPRDELSLLRIVNVPSRGIGEATVAKISEHAVHGGLTFWKSAEALWEGGKLPQKTWLAILAFRDLLERQRAKFQQVGGSLADKVRELVHDVNYAAEISKQYPDNAGMQQTKMQVIEDLYKAMGEYEQRSSGPRLSEFIEQTTLEGRDFAGGSDDWVQDDTVKLITLHSAKGLEFNRVYLVGMEEGLLPHQRSVDEGSRKAIEEERRLAYVGVTRARDYLTLTRSKTRSKYNKRRESPPSRFLKEMFVKKKVESAPEGEVPEANTPSRETPINRETPTNEE